MNRFLMELMKSLHMNYRHVMICSNVVSVMYDSHGASFKISYLNINRVGVLKIHLSLNCSQHNRYHDLPNIGQNV